MKGFTLIELLSIIAIAAFLICIGGSIGNFQGIKTVHKEAIKSGVAEYYIVDNKTGKTEFRWKTDSSIINVQPMCKFIFTNDEEVFTISIDKK